MAEAEATAQEWPIGFRSLQCDRKKHGTKRRPLGLQRRMQVSALQFSGGDERESNHQRGRGEVPVRGGPRSSRTGHLASSGARGLAGATRNAGICGFSQPAIYPK